MTNGWNEGCGLIAHVDNTDFGRRFVPDAPMLARVRALGAKSTRHRLRRRPFLLMLRPEGVETICIDPTPTIEQPSAKCTACCGKEEFSSWPISKGVRYSYRRRRAARRRRRCGEI